MGPSIATRCVLIALGNQGLKTMREATRFDLVLILAYGLFELFESLAAICFTLHYRHALSFVIFHTIWDLFFTLIIFKYSLF